MWAEGETIVRREVLNDRAEGARVAGELAAGRRWWDKSWARWEPAARTDRVRRAR